MLDKRSMTTEKMSKKKHPMMLIPLKNVPKNALKFVKIQLLENFPSCCTLNDAKSPSRKITNNKKNHDREHVHNQKRGSNNWLDDDLTYTCVPLASEDDH